MRKRGELSPGKFPLPREPGKKLMKPGANRSLKQRRETPIDNAFPLMSNAESERLRKLLHDGLGQMLTSATFVASSLRHRLAELGLQETEMVDEMILLLNDAITESRTLAARCTPPAKNAIGECGVVSARE
jgi:signal transduction histidine kinase